MKSAFVNENGVLTSYGYAEANGQDTLIDVPEDFEGEPGRLRFDGKQWLPYKNVASTLVANKAVQSALLQQATLAIAPLQDASDLGTATSAEAASLLVWKQYRVAVNRVDLSAQDLSWPAAPA